MTRKRCPEGYTSVEGKCRKNVTVKYRVEDDNKYWADIDNSGRFGVPFDSYRTMRKSLNPHVKLRKVK